MSMTLDEVLRAARELSPDEREILRIELAEDISPEEQARIDQAWKDEIQRRHELHLKGEAHYRPVEEVITEIFAEFEKNR